MSEFHSALVEGYRLCSVHQDHFVREEVAQRTGGMCAEEFAKRGGVRATTIELVVRGRRLQVPRIERDRKRKKRTTPERAEKRKLNEKAKDSARKRLAAIFPDAYDLLVAEERAALGLEPWPVDRAVRGGDPEVELGFAEMMAELERRDIA